jgi:hypothetical protein
MIASPKVPQINLYPYPRTRFVEVDKKRSAGRKELRHPPSSRTSGIKRPKNWKDSDK